MEVTLGDQGLFGPRGKLSIDDDMLRIVQRGVLEEIAYADILEVRAHTRMHKVTIRTKDRERTLSFPSIWPNRRHKVAAEIESRRLAATAGQDHVETE